MGRVDGAEWRKRKEDQGNLVRKLVPDSLMDRRARGILCCLITLTRAKWDGGGRGVKFKFRLGRLPLHFCCLGHATNLSSASLDAYLNACRQVETREVY